MESEVTSRQAIASAQTRSTLIWLLSSVVVVYCISYGLTFMSDYLGRSPVLDARENLAWAEIIATSALPSEPFYRALFYPWVLAHLPDLSIVRILFGVGCHLLNALLVGLISVRIWGRQRRAAYRLPALLYSLYPVSLYFSAQVLDITFGLSLFLAALYALIVGSDSNKRWVLGLAGVLGALAVLARPNFLPAVLIFPLLPIVMLNSKPFALGRLVKCFLWVSLPLISILSFQGFLNWRISGEFRVLPWQGAYNLYAANRVGANGQYYSQQVSFDAVPAGMNTTRMESEYLYAQAHPAEVAPSIDTMNTYWRSELLAAIRSNPHEWLGLMGRKVIYLLNDWEQYNNLTYAYHKDRFVLLRWNPLGWGMLCILTTAGFLLGWSHLDRRKGLALLLVAAAYAAGFLLFYASARFRLPLVPFLCVASGGLSYLTIHYKNRRRLVILFLACAGMGVLTFVNWFNAQSRETFIQDAVLLAGAASQVGADLSALEYAEEAVALNPERQDVQRVKVKSLFNLWLVSNAEKEARVYWEALIETIDLIHTPDAGLSFIRGLILWDSGSLEASKKVWEFAIQNYGSAARESALALELISAEQSNDLNSSKVLIDARSFVERLAKEIN
jgi:hypothetical protein